MGSKTKIIVLHLKELIYTAIFVLLGILFLVLVTLMLLPQKPGEKPDFSETQSRYVPGKYTTSLRLGSDTVDVEVVVDASNITSVRLVNLTQVVATMYPLMEPCMDTIAEQICEKQSLEDITYPDENQYTSRLLLKAVEAALDKAAVTPKARSQASGSEYLGLL
ncbi:MAG: hypothetical protein Q4C65_09585 [Eubacteriales bacterium]|nr:hypothetical protein [Eubacteriales bacterium]